MTKEQLDAIQEHVDFDDITIHDVIPLLAEVKRLHEENTVLVEANEGEPWAWQFLTKQRDAALAEVERLTAERDAFMALDASYREQINEAALRTNQAFQRGVAAMRREGTKTLLERNDALLRNVRGTMEACVSNVVALELMNAFRQLPDPEDK